jgi:hypothetical protein
LERKQSPMLICIFLRSPPTKETYFRRLSGIFDAIELEGTIFDTRCNLFAMKGIEDPSWAFSCILRFIQSQKNRVDRKEITGGTLRNCVKVIKTFCEVIGITIHGRKFQEGFQTGNDMLMIGPRHRRNQKNSRIS